MIYSIASLSLLLLRSFSADAFSAAPAPTLAFLSSPHTKESTSRQTSPMKMTNTQTTTPTATSTSTFQPIKGLSEISSSHSLFLLDMWGVMHNGKQPYEGVLQCVENLKAQDKKMIILSNSSKRKENALKMLTKLGFDPMENFVDVITSGEISHRMLAGDPTLQCTQWPILSNLLSSSSSSTKKVFVFGSGDGDEEYCTTAGWTLSSIQDADLILARGTFTINDGSSVTAKKECEKTYFETMDTVLKEAAKLNVPMLVSNPDKLRPDADLSPMPGAIGDAYYDALLLERQQNGKSDEDNVDGLGIIKRIGKPYPEVYEIALSLQQQQDGDSEVSYCMVGDALETDIVGGIQNSCSTCWVIRDGIHGAKVDSAGDGDLEVGAKYVMEEFNQEKEEDVVPTFVVPHFRW